MVEVEKLVNEAETLSLEEKSTMERLDKERQEAIEKFEAKRAELQKRLTEVTNQAQTQVSLLQNLGGRMGVGTGHAQMKETRKKAPTTTRITGKDAVINLLRNRGKSNFSQIGEALKKNGYGSNPGVLLGKLVEDKVIRRVERGIYDL